MERIIFLLLLTGFNLMVAEQSAQANEEVRSWDELRNGSIAVQPVGIVSYEIAYTRVGFDHFEASVSATWEDEGLRSQVLFEGIHDKAPAKISAVGSRLCISVEYCQRYQDECPVWSTMHSYDQEEKRFVASSEQQQPCNSEPVGLSDLR